MTEEQFLTKITDGVMMKVDPWLKKEMNMDEKGELWVNVKDFIRNFCETATSGCGCEHH